jgi:hypothetical protein
MRTIKEVNRVRVFEAIEALSREKGYNLRRQGNHLVIMCPPYSEADIVVSF